MRKVNRVRGLKNKAGKLGVNKGLIAVIAVIAVATLSYFNLDPIYEYLGLSPKRTVAPPAEGTVQLHFIDVGQGDSTLILTPEKSVLIDSGESPYAEAVISYVKSLGVTKLDVVIATHPHADHIGGMGKIITELKPSRLIMPDKPHDTNTFMRMLDAIEEFNVAAEYAVAGRRIELDNCFIEIIGPARDFDGSSALNNSSVVAKLVHGENRVLFTGDMEKAAEDDVLERKADISSNVLHVSHHGSDSSSHRRFLEAVKRGNRGDMYAIISVGEGNSYNHPHDELLQRLSAMGFTILRTDERGTIVLESAETGLEVK